MNMQQPFQAASALSLTIQEKSEIRSQNKSCAINARIGSEIIFDPTILDTYHYDGWRSIHYDLLVVCAAVEYADRNWARHADSPNRSFSITVPVVEQAVWAKPEVHRALENVLWHLTGDHWHFVFSQSIEKTSEHMRQRPLFFSEKKEFAIAYSDGLDSRCVSGLFDKGNIAVRMRVTNKKDHINSGERPFDLFPFKVKVKTRESGVRSRGFKFAAITAIGAHLSSVDRIIVPESGQGALGPVLLPLHNIYPDYRNHPTFFRRMERFIRALLEFSVNYEQPQLWNTKGQTISAFLAVSESGENIVRNTRSCWQQRWNTHIERKFRQCGLCAACLLRRMSLQAAGVSEPRDTYFFSDLTTETYEAAIPKENCQPPTKSMIEYGSVGARHFHQLSNMANVPDNNLRVHAHELAKATDCAEDDTLKNLRKLLMNHAKEWNGFLDTLGPKSFIRNWTKGGRYD